MKINFFTVSLSENIETLITSIELINKYYDVPTFSIICPDDSVGLFLNAFDSYTNVIIAPESSLISKAQFIQIANDYVAENLQIKFNPDRIGWYYQQVLKISFIFNQNNKFHPLVMWDADTIPLCKIDFFKKNQSLLYGSLVEFHQPYFKTMESIFGSLPPQYLAFTVQFFTCTHHEAVFLEKKLNQYCFRRKDMSVGYWISKIVIRSTYETHGVMDDSFFSEQELVGLSNMLSGISTQIPIAYLRWHFDGILSPLQIFFVRILGFKHITYENIRLLQSKKQNWYKLVLYVYKEVRIQFPDSPLNFSFRKYISKFKGRV